MQALKQHAKRRRKTPSYKRDDRLAKRGARDPSIQMRLQQPFAPPPGAWRADHAGGAASEPAFAGGSAPAAGESDLVIIDGDNGSDEDASVVCVDGDEDDSCPDKTESEFPQELIVLVEQQLDKNYVEGNPHTFKAPYLKQQLQAVVDKRNQLLQKSRCVDKAMQNRYCA